VMAAAGVARHAASATLTAANRHPDRGVAA
jgi:hypothetical protein